MVVVYGWVSTDKHFRKVVVLTSKHPYYDCRANVHFPYIGIKG